MEKQKKLEEPSEETAVEESDQSKRDFITKLVTTAGAVAAAGLLAGAASDPAAGAAIIKGGVTIHKTGAAQFKYDKHKNGFSIVLSGPQLGDSLVRSGLLGEGANANTARITIEFSY